MVDWRQLKNLLELLIGKIDLFRKKDLGYIFIYEDVGITVYCFGGLLRIYIGYNPGATFVIFPYTRNETPNMIDIEDKQCQQLLRKLFEELKANCTTSLPPSEIIPCKTLDQIVNEVLLLYPFTNKSFVIFLFQEWMTN